MTPLLAAPLLVQLHVAFGVSALAVGAARVAWPHGERVDRRLGWLFLGLLVAAAAFAAGLRTPPGTPTVAGVTPGHAFIAVTAAGLVAVAYAARTRNRLLWRNLVTALFAGVVLTCGLLELAPGRIMNSVLAGGAIGG